MATKKGKTADTVKVQYYKSMIGAPEKLKRVVKGLGMRRLNSVREFKDTPSLRGMLAKIPHMVRVVDE